MTVAVELTLLVDELLKAKVVEEAAKQRRIDFEELIAVFIPTKEVGQKTETLPDGSKVTVKRALSYKANISEIRNLFINFQDVTETSAYPPIKTSTTETLDIFGYEWYRKNDPHIFSELSKLVEIKPKKVSVVIQEPKGE